MNGLMLSLVFAKGIVPVQKYPKSFNKENNCVFVCVFFSLSVLAGHDSNGAAWIFTRVSLKIKICFYVLCGAGLCTLLPEDINEARTCYFF